MLLDRRHVVTSCLLLTLCSLASVSTAMCPAECSCRSDAKGRRKVKCSDGGLIDPIPVEQMDVGMEVLEITAPSSPSSSPSTAWNYLLTIGPIFQRFKQLQEIHITRSNLMQVSQHAFWGVPSLRVLNLSFNNLTIVYDHNFRGLANLLELHLNDNRIERLPSGAFKHLPELRILTLERNRLSELVPRLFVKLTNLQVLRIGGNPLVELNPEVFKDVLELRVFECRDCHLRRINTQIYHLLPFLTHLDLGRNRLQFIDSEEFVDLRRLDTLKLDGNQLPVVLERTFVNQINLHKLSLANNRLAKITNQAFKNLTNLIELDIGYNKLTQLESDSLAPFASNLRRLVLSGNNFQAAVLRVVFQVLNRLTDLSLADMKLSALPLGLPTNLARLNVSGNAISNLTGLPKKLIALDASRNELTKLDDDRVLDRLEQLTELDLSANRWNCGRCAIAKLFLRTNFSKNFDGVRCSTPGALKGKLLRQSRYDELPLCDDADDGDSYDSTKRISLLIGGASIASFLAFSVAFVVWSCLRRHANNRRYNVEIEKKEKRRGAARSGDGASAGGCRGVGGGIVIVDGRCIISDADNAQVIFDGKGEINFKFPLDLTEQGKLSVATIDEMKKEERLRGLPNGTGI